MKDLVEILLTGEEQIDCPNYIEEEKLSSSKCAYYRISTRTLITECLYNNYFYKGKYSVNHGSINEVLCTILNRHIIDNISFIEYEQSVFRIDDLPKVYGSKSLSYRRSNCIELPLKYIEEVLMNKFPNLDKLIEITDSKFIMNSRDYYSTILAIDNLIRNTTRSREHVVLITDCNTTKVDFTPMFDLSRSLNGEVNSKIVSRASEELIDKGLIKKLKIDKGGLYKELDEYSPKFDIATWVDLKDKLKTRLELTEGDLWEEV